MVRDGTLRIGLVTLAILATTYASPTRSATTAPIIQLPRVDRSWLQGSEIGSSAGLQALDPAAVGFFPFLQYNAMQLIAPNLFGAFESATATQLSSGALGTGPMKETAGVDPATADLVRGVHQGGISIGSPALANQLGVASGDLVIGANGARTYSGYGVAGPQGDVWAETDLFALSQDATAAGVRPACESSEMAKELQAGGKYWSEQNVNPTPVQFPRGVFKGAQIANPLGDLGPSGNPSNLPSPGAAGEWCRPSPIPFTETSPIESRLVWGVSAILVAGVAIFYLSRSAHMPA